MPPSSSARAALETLGRRLREIRTRAGLTQSGLARQAGWHPSKVSKIEYGRQAPSEADIRTWCHRCHADDRIEELTSALRAAEDMFVEWRHMERGGLARAQEAVIPVWERTHHFHAYDSWMVPGPFQTRAYTTAVLSSITRFRGLPDEIAQAVDVRMERQRILHEGDHRFAVVLEESVLRYRIGDAETMAGQLGHLITVASLPSVSLGIIPMTAARTRWPVEGFWIFDNTRVNVELVSGWLTITQPHEIKLYLEAFKELAAMAVHAAEARNLVLDAIRALGETMPGHTTSADT